MLRVMPVATRVDQGEKERADAARAEARERFDRLLDWLDDDQIAEYWAAVETPYLPFYGFEEVLAVFGDSPAQRSSMLAAVEGLAYLGTNETIAPLLQAFHDDASAMVRERAGCSLAQSGMLTQEQRRSVIPKLLDYADDASLDAQTHGWVYQALRDITGQTLANDSASWREWYSANRS